MKTPSKILLSLLAVLLVAFATPAPANLVTNGGFETGDFTGWMQGGNLGGTFVQSQVVNTGDFAAALGPESKGGSGSLSQTLSTTAGAFYDLTFFLAQGDLKTSPMGFGTTAFQVFWNGTMIFNTTDPSHFPFTQNSFSNLAATSTSTVLQFVFVNDPAFYFLDDVSVLAAQGAGVPETLSTLWLALPLIGMFGFARLRRKTTPAAALA